VQISAASEGLGRVRAIFKSDEDIKVLESEFAEVAVYKPLETSAPEVSLFQ